MKRIIYLTGVVASFATTGISQAIAKPNVIFILTDDLGYGELGCYGQQLIKTPCIDQMAVQGKLFTRHYAGSPVCAPSRCILLTGKHGGHAAIRGNGELKQGQRPPPAVEVSPGEFFKGSGAVRTDELVAYAESVFRFFGRQKPVVGSDLVQTHLRQQRKQYMKKS
jgi:hypothetical protein